MTAVEGEGYAKAVRVHHLLRLMLSHCRKVILHLFATGAAFKGERTGSGALSTSPLLLLRQHTKATELRATAATNADSAGFIGLCWQCTPGTWRRMAVTAAS